MPTLVQIVELAHNDLIEHLKTLREIHTDGYLYTRRNQQDKLCAVISFRVSPHTNQIGYTVGITTVSEAVAFSKRISQQYPMKSLDVSSMPDVLSPSKPKNEKEG